MFSLFTNIESKLFCLFIVNILVPDKLVTKHRDLLSRPWLGSRSSDDRLVKHYKSIRLHRRCIITT